MPDDLIEALQTLSTQPDPPPEPFEQIARWRRACGDAEAAETWQTWSLLPATNALVALWRSLAQCGNTAAAADVLAASAGRNKQESWQMLALLLEQANLEGACELQRQLLRDPPQLAISELLDLLRQWQQLKQPQQALDLLQPLLNFMHKNGEQPSGPICTAMADLLEKLKRYDEAETRWKRSHAPQPQQAWPLMRRPPGFRRRQPSVALHYACQVLERDPITPLLPACNAASMPWRIAVR